MSSKGSTPLMKQFWEAKKAHPGSIMLFRMGDFYETFDEDAILTADILGIALTKRANGAAATVPLAGFPYHALDQYLHKLLKSGHRVAICEQMEDPKMAKGIVKREVVEVHSPGTALTDRYLNKKENNFLCAVTLDKTKCGIALQYLTAFAVATNVNDGIKTSSFFFTPNNKHETCKADVPELVATTYFDFVKPDIFFSNFFIKFPLAI